MSKPKNLLSVLLEKSPASCFVVGAMFLTYFTYAVYGRDGFNRSLAVFESSVFLLLLVILFFAKLPNDRADSVSKKIAERQEALEREVADAIKCEKNRNS